jgi:hypothetical protein
MKRYRERTNPAIAAQKKTTDAERIFLLDCFVMFWKVTAAGG